MGSGQGRVRAADRVLWRLGGSRLSSCPALGSGKSLRFPQGSAAGFGWCPPRQSFVSCGLRESSAWAPSFRSEYHQKPPKVQKEKKNKEEGAVRRDNLMNRFVRNKLLIVTLFFWNFNLLPPVCDNGKERVS